MSTELEAIPIEIKFENLGVTLKSGKSILSGVTGKINPGRLTAVMGPSGAGKTTFLNILTGKIQKTEGRVWINGREMEIDDIKREVGFVPQEDTMIRVLTVKETLLHSAKICSPKGTDSVKRNLNVTETLDVLGLTSVRHTIIGDEKRRGVSGGQRKRVNIGIELVKNPLLLFLDEPTTGLDSTTAEELCGFLQEIAHRGRTVVSVIHQPRYEIFLMFDDIILLGKGGRVVYAGPTSKVMKYFNRLGFECPVNTNPADFFLDCMSDRVVPSDRETFRSEELFGLWEEHEEENQSGKKEVDEEKEEDVHGEGHAAAAGGVVGGGVGASSFTHQGGDEDDGFEGLVMTEGVVVKQRTLSNMFHQFKAFCGRAFIQLYRDHTGLMIALMLHFGAGFGNGASFNPSFGTLYSPALPKVHAEQECPEIIRDRCMDEPISQMLITALCFTFAMVLGTASTVAAIRTFGEERPVFWREAASGRSSIAYFLGKNVADLPLIIVNGLLYTSFFYVLTEPRGSFFSYLFVSTLLIFAAYALGYIVSGLTSGKNAYTVAIVMAMCLSITSGDKPSLKDVNEQYSVLVILWQLSYCRWTSEALYITEVSTYKDDYRVQGGYTKIGFHQDYYPLDCTMIFVLGVLLRVVAYLVLRFRHRDKQK
eukprot:TRINITY_DN9121_c1_g1_i5.p1 TRINITY_DN9121_c1_g1~~TRINITY_DN9121_c1_g1_i5.p1  ORF type:complete len:650 (+),score=169.31 TRINITY_DN9121_c1_g1_i5:340-2289(+)